MSRTKDLLVEVEDLCLQVRRLEGELAAAHAPALTGPSRADAVIEELCFMAPLLVAQATKEVDRRLGVPSPGLRRFLCIGGKAYSLETDADRKVAHAALAELGISYVMIARDGSVQDEAPGGSGAQ